MVICNVCKQHGTFNINHACFKDFVRSGYDKLLYNTINEYAGLAHKKWRCNMRAERLSVHTSHAANAFWEQFFSRPTSFDFTIA